MFVLSNKWMNDINVLVVIVIVGCKKDLASQREVATSEGIRLARDLKTEFCEVSSKTGESLLFINEEQELNWQKTDIKEIFDLILESLDVEKINNLSSDGVPSVEPESSCCWLFN